MVPDHRNDDIIEYFDRSLNETPKTYLDLVYKNLKENNVPPILRKEKNGNLDTRMIQRYKCKKVRVLVKISYF